MSSEYTHVNDHSLFYIDAKHVCFSRSFKFIYCGSMMNNGGLFLISK